MEAALAIALLSSGRFVLIPGGPPPERTIEVAMMEVVLEATRLFDETR